MAKAMKGKMDDRLKKGLGGSRPSVEVSTLSLAPLAPYLCNERLELIAV